MANDQIRQHAKLAMGNLKNGGTKVAMKSGGMVKGVQINPITAVKQGNSIPGMKSGGKVSKKK